MEKRPLKSPRKPMTSVSSTQPTAKKGEIAFSLEQKRNKGNDSESDDEGSGT